MLLGLYGYARAKNRLPKIYGAFIFSTVVVRPSMFNTYRQNKAKADDGYLIEIQAALVECNK